MIAAVKQTSPVIEQDEETKEIYDEQQEVVELADYPPVQQADTGDYDTCSPVAATSSLPVHSGRMLVRSLSTNGKVEVVSVKLDLPLDGLTTQQIIAQGLNALKLETEIIESFFSGAISPPLTAVPVNGHRRFADSTAEEEESAVPATLVDIGKTKNNAYFINVKVGAQTARLFGHRRDLVMQLARAGVDLTPEAISERLTLNIPCRAVTKPSNDGRYLLVVKLFPAK
jgi:hypothetical protein